MSDKALKQIRITQSGLTIYDRLLDRPDLYFSNEELQRRLTEGLVGLNLDYKLRTRSKVARSAVCECLGYPVPSEFTKVQPRFPGQNFDMYVQKSLNLQIWNEEISPTRRYVLVRLNEKSVVTAVRVLTGKALQIFDTTGTLTVKSQAAEREVVDGSELVVAVDTSRFQQYALGQTIGPNSNSTSEPSNDSVRKQTALPIKNLYERLSLLVGVTFEDPGKDQERNRGESLHRLVVKALDIDEFYDPGSFPDVPSQMLELKLQTSPTVDLGVVLPDSVEPLSPVSHLRHCDVRFGVFFATLSDRTVRIDRLVLSTGERFFDHFRRFAGIYVNSKLQLKLSESLWD